jgi:polyisoprenyl-teichoic acid--peptidoglycan teichoic acid transferase
LKKIFIILAILLVVIIGTGIGGLYYIDSKVYVSQKGKSKFSVTNSVSAFQGLINAVINQSGVDNIILTGTDARSKDTASRTDSIMMATIDRTNKAVKLTSFMRDMFVPIPGYKKNYKINTAYFLGGPSLLIQTLNQNFNTNAEYYVTIDFSAFQALVDKFNGIDIDVKPYEIKEMNKYIKEENWGNPDYVNTSGPQHLNGQQVLSYCRIRKVGNNDYERTERQRKVLSILIQKVRKQGIVNLFSLLNTISPYIKTNIPSTKLLTFGISAYKFGNSPVSTLRIPADGMYTNQVVSGQDALIPDFRRNTNVLSQFITSKSLPQDKSNINALESTDIGNAKQISDNIGTNDLKGNGLTSPGFSSNRNSTNSSAITERSSINVSILNSTGKAGLAAVYKTRLEALGYRVTNTDNYLYKKYSTTIINDYSRKGYGAIISEDLKFGNVIRKQKAKPTASIVIILGNDSENK